MVDFQSILVYELFINPTETSHEKISSLFNLLSKILDSLKGYQDLEDYLAKNQDELDLVATETGNLDKEKAVLIWQILLRFIDSKSAGFMLEEGFKSEYLVFKYLIEKKL